MSNPPSSSHRPGPSSKTTTTTMLLLWCTVELKWIACFDNRGFEKFHMALSAKIPAGTKPEDLPSEVKQSMLGAVGLNKGSASHPEILLCPSIEAAVDQQCAFPLSEQHP